MRRTLLSLLLITPLFISASVVSPNALAQENPIVVMETNKGAIKVELWVDRAPISVANFLRYTDDNFFDGLIFHRVISGFMIQSGGFTPDMVKKPAYEPIKNEARGDLPNNRGTLAMARTGVIDSATSQFFINLVDNDFLNHTSATPRGFGYAVFGQVIEGMDVVDQIAAVKTASGIGGLRDIPVEPVIIISAKRQE